MSSKHQSSAEAASDADSVVEQGQRSIGPEQLVHQIAVVGKRQVILKRIEATERQAINPFRMRQPSGKNERKTNAIIDGDLPK